MIHRNPQSLLRRTAAAVAASCLFLTTTAAVAGVSSTTSCVLGQVTVDPAGNLGSISCAPDTGVGVFTIQAPATVSAATSQGTSSFTLARSGGTVNGTLTFTVASTSGACNQALTPIKQHFTGANDDDAANGLVRLTINAPTGGTGTCTVSLKDWTPDGTAQAQPIGLGGQSATIQVTN